MKPTIATLIVLTILFATPATSAGEQTPAARDAQALRVFLDCGRCDFDYLRREVTFVDYVRDREDSDVHVLVTTRSSGSGTEWTFAFIGRNQAVGTDITLVYNSSSTDTDDEVREGYAQVIRIGVLNYLVGSPLVERISIDYETPVAAAEQPEVMAQPQDDPWNFWVFRASFDADFEGQQRTTEKGFSGSFSANRTTEDWKIRTRVEGNYDREEFELSDGSTLVSDTSNYGGSGQVVKSLGEHWGASVRAAADSSTFRNVDFSISTAPGIEYNIFPYSDSSRRQLTFTYEIGFTNLQYEEETIFDKTEESLFDHMLLANYSVNQPWGEASLSSEVGQFLNHPSQYRAEFGGRLEFRITRGLSIDLDGEFQLVRDQRFLPKGGVTDEEVLLRRRALATDYDYEFSVGFSYTFGSIFNNVVNPRFDGRRGGFFF